MKSVFLGIDNLKSFKKRSSLNLKKQPNTILYNIFTIQESCPSLTMDVKDGSSEFVSISPDTTNQADEKKSNVPDDNSLIADFETPEEYLLHYARTGNSAKLSQLFDVIRDESAELDLNAKGKQKSNRGWTALHLASYFGHLDVVKLLLEVFNV